MEEEAGNLWNSGMLMAGADALLEECRTSS
jgi:mannose-1-phosphate guanylyltransferase